MIDPVFAAALNVCGVDPFEPICMYDEAYPALSGMFREPITSALYEWRDEDPDFDPLEYVRLWKEYWDWKKGQG